MSLDRSLDDIIESSWDANSKSNRTKGKGKSRSRVMLDDDDDDDFDQDRHQTWRGGAKGWERDLSKGWSKGKGKNKGKGKGRSFKGDGDYEDEETDYDMDVGGRGSVPYWMEHDDRLGDEEEVPLRKAFSKGYAKGKDRKTDETLAKGFREPSEPWGKGFSGKGKSTWLARSFGAGESPGIGQVFARSVMVAPQRQERGYAVDRGTFRRVEEQPDFKASKAAGLGYGASAMGRGQKRARPETKKGQAATESEDEEEEDEEEDEEEEEEVKPPPRTKARTEAKSGPKSIKVSNIPKKLKADDIKEAFEAEAGKIAECKLSKGGTARITFHKAKDAQKAVDTFDKGELNGKVISVVLQK